MAVKTLKFKLAVTAVIFTVLATTSWLFVSPSTLQSDVSSSIQSFEENHSRTIAELLNHRNVATLLPREAFSEKSIHPNFCRIRYGN